MEINPPNQVKNQSEGLVIRPEPEVLALDATQFGHRRYLPIWERCLRNPGKKVVIKMTIPSETQFQTIRKAFWKIKSEDVANRARWRSKCERDGDKIWFWIVPADITTRI